MESWEIHLTNTIQFKELQKEQSQNENVIFRPFGPWRNKYDIDIKIKNYMNISVYWQSNSTHSWLVKVVNISAVSVISDPQDLCLDAFQQKVRRSVQSFDVLVSSSEPISPDIPVFQFHPFIGNSSLPISLMKQNCLFMFDLEFYWMLIRDIDLAFCIAFIIKSFQQFIKWVLFLHFCIIIQLKHAELLIYMLFISCKRFKSSYMYTLFIVMRWLSAIHNWIFIKLLSAVNMHEVVICHEYS